MNDAEISFETPNATVTPNPAFNRGESGAPGRQRSPRLKTHLVRRRRDEGEVVTRSASIQNFCRECLGWDAGGHGSLAAAIRACPSTKCWLYPWRNGRLDQEVATESDR